MRPAFAVLEGAVDKPAIQADKRSRPIAGSAVDAIDHQYHEVEPALVGRDDHLIIRRVQPSARIIHGLCQRQDAGSAVLCDGAGIADMSAGGSEGPVMNSLAPL